MKGLIAAMVAVLVSVAGASRAEDEVPAPFTRFEPMVGGWKGTARPAANRVRGWGETHSWAWKFVKGTPVGVTLSIVGGKILSKGEIAYSASTKKYTIKGTDPAGKPATFVGGPSADGKALVFDRVGATPEGKERLTIRPNGIRYTMLLDRQAPGAPQFKNAIEVGLTKEGESFAAGGASADGPKCIITGGSASMTVGFNGKSFPICCTGCRDEFNDNPEKYIARAAAKAAGESEKPAAKPARPSRSDGEFEGLIDAPKTKPGKKP